MGKKYYFDRSGFDADLKRIQAFYADRGYPDARVTGFDVKLDDKQDEVDIAVTISEGEPVNELKDHGYPYGKVSTNENTAVRAFHGSAAHGRLAFFMNRPRPSSTVLRCAMRPAQSRRVCGCNQSAFSA